MATACGGIVVEGGRVLLVRLGYGPNAGLWMLPGGLMEANESMEACAEREVREETGVAAKALSLAGVRHGRREGAADEFYFAFTMAYAGGTPAPDGRETVAAAWVPVAEALGAADMVALSREMLIAALAGGGMLRRPVPAPRADYSHYAVYGFPGPGPR